jgi:hypothetical protein
VSRSTIVALGGVEDDLHKQSSREGGEVRGSVKKGDHDLCRRCCSPHLTRVEIRPSSNGGERSAGMDMVADGGRMRRTTQGAVEHRGGE